MRVTCARVHARGGRVRVGTRRAIDSTHRPVLRWPRWTRQFPRRRGAKGTAVHVHGRRCWAYSGGMRREPAPTRRLVHLTHPAPNVCHGLREGNVAGVGSQEVSLTLAMARVPGFLQRAGVGSRRPRGNPGRMVQYKSKRCGGPTPALQSAGEGEASKMVRALTSRLDVAVSRRSATEAVLSGNHRHRMNAPFSPAPSWGSGPEVSRASTLPRIVLDGEGRSECWASAGAAFRGGNCAIVGSQE